jgi:hypothetical protein
MATQASPALLHRFLGIGLVVLAVVFLVLRSRGVPAALPPGEVTMGLAYGMSAIGVVMAAAALLFMRRRVPVRRHGQSEEQYWARPDVLTAVLPVWFLLEGASIVAAVGYLMTAAPVTAVTAGILIGLSWLNGPASFTKVT